MTKSVKGSKVSQAFTNILSSKLKKLQIDQYLKFVSIKYLLQHGGEILLKLAPFEIKYEKILEREWRSEWDVFWRKSNYRSK